MKIWIDFANSPHVPFFAPIIEELHRRGHETLLTAREFAQTTALLDLYGLKHEVIGEHGGKGKLRKLLNISGRARRMSRWAKENGVDLAVSHNSYSQVLAARMAGVPVATIMDFEFTPANHVAFRFANRVIVPFTFSDEDLRRYGAKLKKVRRYDGLKEDVYLHAFEPDPAYRGHLENLFSGRPVELLYMIRPPATMAAYHDFENPLFAELIEWLKGQDSVSTILLPRTDGQKQELEQHLDSSIVVPDEPLDGRNAIYHCDAVVSAGGTMCREAAVLGTESFTMFRGKMGSVDRHLIAEGKLTELRTAEDFSKLPLQRASGTRDLDRERMKNVMRQVIDYCLELVES